MTKHCYCYRVRVETSHYSDGVIIADGSMWKCLDSAIYIVTNEPELIAIKIGDKFVSMERVGFGYYMETKKQ